MPRPIQAFPLQSRLEPTTTTDRSLDLALFSAGELEGRANRDPDADGRRITLQYSLLSLPEAALVEDILQKTRGVTRLSLQYMGGSICVRAEDGYTAEVSPLGTTIKLVVTQCKCPHTAFALAEEIRWDTGYAWDSGFTWDITP